MAPGASNGGRSHLLRQYALSVKSRFGWTVQLTKTITNAPSPTPEKSGLPLSSPEKGGWPLSTSSLIPPQREAATNYPEKAYTLVDQQSGGRHQAAVDNPIRSDVRNARKEAERNARSIGLIRRTRPPNTAVSKAKVA